MAEGYGRSLDGAGSRLKNRNPRGVRGLGQAD